MKNICVAVDTNGYLKVIGEYTPTAEYCPLVVTDTPNIVGLYPFTISSEDGILISAAIVGIWSIGFTARLISKMLIYRS